MQLVYLSNAFKKAGSTSPTPAPFRATTTAIQYHTLTMTKMLATFDLSIPVGLLIRTMTADLIGYSCCSNGATTEVNLNFFQLKCCTILHFYWPISSCTPDFSFRKMPNVRCIVSNHWKIIFLYILFSVLQNPIMINVPSRMTPFQIKIWCCCYNKFLHIRFQ